MEVYRSQTRAMSVQADFGIGIHRNYLASASFPGFMGRHCGEGIPEVAMVTRPS